MIFDSLVKRNPFVVSIETVQWHLFEILPVPRTFSHVRCHHFSLLPPVISFHPNGSRSTSKSTRNHLSSIVLSVATRKRNLLEEECLGHRSKTLRSLRLWKDKRPNQYNNDFLSVRIQFLLALSSTSYPQHDVSYRKFRIILFMLCM